VINLFKNVKVSVIFYILPYGTFAGVGEGPSVNVEVGSGEPAVDVSEGTPVVGVKVAVGDDDGVVVALAVGVTVSVSVVVGVVVTVGVWVGVVEGKGV
jgi:hypothetical protein